MGKIKEQTIQGTVYSYLGVLLGFAVSGLMMPKFFTTAENGLISVLISWSALFGQLATLGFGNATGRLFSWFRDEKSRHHGFSALMLMVGLAGFLLTMVLLFFARPFMLQNSAGEQSALADYFLFLVPLSFFTMLYLLLDVYFKMLYRTVIGTFIKEFLLRLLVTVSLALFYFGVIDFEGFILVYVIVNCIPAVILFVMLAVQEGVQWKPDTGFLDKGMVRSLVSMSFFGIIVGFSNVLVLSVDRIMVERMLGMEAAGIYAITFFFGTLVVIPARSLRKIAGTLLAEAWKNNDHKQIEEIYNKSIVNQLIMGTLIFVGVWSNIHNVFEILPAAYEPGKWVIFFVALSGLVEMSSGVSEILVQTSIYYRFSALLNALFFVLIVVFNFVFIQLFGLVGAAIANVVAYFLTNIIRYLYIYQKTSLRPFHLNHLITLALGAAVYFIVAQMPVIKPFMLDILIRSSLISLMYVVPVYFLKLSEDLNALIDGYLRRLGLVN